MPSEEERDTAGEAGWMIRLGEACLRALGVVALTSIPAALRARGAGGGLFDALIAGMGVLLPPVLVALLLTRAAGRGFRQLVGTEPRRPVVLGVALWLALATPLLVGLGAFLKATTHHRGLGGATFGVLALALVAGAALVAQRLVGLGRTLVERGVKPWIPALAGAALGMLPLVSVAIPLGHHGDDPGGPAVRAAILDGAIVVVATALAAVTGLGAQLRRAARLGGVPAAVVVVVAGLARVESSPALARAMRAGGGLASTLLGNLAKTPDASESPSEAVDHEHDRVDAPSPAPASSEAAPAPSSSAAPPSSDGDAGAAAQPTTAGRPDIVMVTLDSVRADHTSAYGYDKPTTPRLAELAGRGVLFEHAYAAGGDPQQAMAPVATGKTLADTKHDKREWPTILPGNDTVAERLRRAGYRTAAVTSFAWLSEERGFAQGFEVWKPVFEGMHPEREVTGPLTVKAALAAWKQLEGDTHPIFLWVHLFDAHEQFLEHPGIKFKGKTGAYDGEIAFVDQQLGELMAAIGGGPRGGHVAWVVHGSQGEGFDEHDFRGHTGEVYDEALRVPLVVALPGAQPARYGKAAVSILDVPATVVDLAGAAADGLAGVSLAPIARGDVARAHGPVYARSQRRVALIDWPLKLILIERKKKERVLLFDLGADPGEQKDVAQARAADVERLQKERAGIESASK